jgi:hypothetical protein
MCVLVQLETAPAVDALEAIAAVDGVDGVFIGPSDLSASLGFLGEPRHPEVRRVIADACRRAQDAGKPIGILAPVVDDAAGWFDLGFSFVAVGSDILSLAHGSRRAGGTVPVNLASVAHPEIFRNRSGPPLDPHGGLRSPPQRAAACLPSACQGKRPPLSCADGARAPRCRSRSGR